MLCMSVVRWRTFMVKTHKVFTVNCAEDDVVKEAHSGWYILRRLSEQPNMIR